jgi:hypothetical protein
LGHKGQSKLEKIGGEGAGADVRHQRNGMAMKKLPDGGKKS